MPRYQGRLELTWTNKDQCLLAHDDGSYEWLPPSDYRVAEVRLLDELQTIGEVGRHHSADSNLLIEGDALHALRSLAKLPEFRSSYVGKVKLAYIDPPFNTGQAFEHYDDALEHSVWLTMMRDRLVQIRDLLAPDGSVWLHLDDGESHRARAVMDEIFGVDAFVATIIWQKKYSRDNRPAIGGVHDYIHVYSPLGAQWKTVRNRVPRVNASAYRNPNNDPEGPWRPIPLDVQGGHATASQFYDVTTPSGRVVRPANNRAWSVTEPVMQAMIARGEVYFGLKGDGMPNTIRYLRDDQGLVPWTWWTHEEVGDNDEAKKEIVRLFGDSIIFDTPKPERLLQRIIHIATDPGDLVLDCFVGSGTTAAVAHKMNRRWVAVERDPSVYEKFALTRLRRVVDGSDAGGISVIEVPTGDGLPDKVKPGEAKRAGQILKQFGQDALLDEVDGLTEQVLRDVIDVLSTADKTKSEAGWKGGGGFRALRVAPSMFEEDGGLVYLSDAMTNGLLAEATAAQLGYSYEVATPFVGRKGRARLAVIDGVANEAVVKLLVSALDNGERAVVCGTGIDPEARTLLKELAPGSTLRKIPSALLDRYRGLGTSSKRPRSSAVVAIEEGTS